MAKPADTIEDAAKRVIRSIEVARERARDAGEPGADGIGADAYAVARYVLDGDSGEAARLRAEVARLTDAMERVRRVVTMALPAPITSAPVDPSSSTHRDNAFGAALASFPEARGPLRDEELGRGGLPVDPANPAQTVVPGSIESQAAPTAADDAGAAAVEKAKREPAALVPIVSWDPGTGMLLELGQTYGGKEAVERHLERFREEHKGESQARWGKTFRAWLTKNIAPTPVLVPA